MGLAQAWTLNPREWYYKIDSQQKRLCYCHCTWKRHCCRIDLYNTLIFRHSAEPICHNFFSLNITMNYPGSKTMSSQAREKSCTFCNQSSLPRHCPRHFRLLSSIELFSLVNIQQNTTLGLIDQLFSRHKLPSFFPRTLLLPFL